MAARTPTISAQPKRGGNVTVRPRSAQGKAGVAARPRTTRVKGKVQPETRHMPAIVVKAALVLVALVSIFAAYKIFAASSIFSIKKYEVVGNVHASEDEIIRTVKAATKNQSLLEADLNKIRHDIESKPIVKTATVARVIPDTLRIAVEERQPVVLARKENGSFIWLSADAVEIGDLDVFRPAKMPPVLVGLSEGDKSDHAIHDNKDRVVLYQKILGELGPDANAIEQIDLTVINPTIINFQLKDSRIFIQVGNIDHHSDLRAALNAIDAARRGDRARLGELHVTDIDTLIANPSRISYVYSLNGKLSFGFTSVTKSASQSSKSASARKVR
ncbi:MAG TPA: FtsQ-type POTRA domain-containing protein [Blastocatellia bacterium]|nr:FtsQ-type POTRA domain-containing protein [Blastocatellia bacterium]